MNLCKHSGLQIASLGFYRRSKLNPLAALASFRPLHNLSCNQTFRLCLPRLSFHIIHKPQISLKYRCCQDEWLKEERSSERDIEVDVELVLTASPAFSSCLQKTRDGKEWDFASTWADGINCQLMLLGPEDWQSFPRAEDSLLKQQYAPIFNVPHEEMLSVRQKQKQIKGTINFLTVWSG